ncbi:MAG: CBS domain-containing protein [Burkholderiales bacterium]|nr:CBS domain-containing protein [Burkholderiales bacterium]MDE1928728.1 CBS domain-containing protein [Burkholderiales bacterium]MDE2160236.1 CBS domain-containing protein [Burkholderiales bacterium]MDE2503686.1 CBS domain-containing protein [Burkholderiales bacterium]
MEPDSALPTFRVDPGTLLAQAAPGQGERVTRDSPALAVMTDLTQAMAATTAPSTTLRQAEQIMIFKGVRMLFVVTDMPSVEGLITSVDLRSDRTLQLVHERGLHYDELSVGDVMTPLASVEAIAYERMRTARVGQLIATMQRYGRNHLLVVEAATEDAPQRMRGVISRAQIERQLGERIELTPIASSFSEIKHALS